MVSWHPQCKLTWTIALECSSVSDKEGGRVWRREVRGLSSEIGGIGARALRAASRSAFAFVHDSRPLESRHTVNTATRDYYGNRATSLMVPSRASYASFFFFAEVSMHQIGQIGTISRPGVQLVAGARMKIIVFEKVQI